MFGAVRTVLALMVATSHLLLTNAHQLGVYAVFAFYVISGYLMTLIMQEGYGHSPAGRRAFIINRFLRLYPQYWSALALSVALIAALDPAPSHYNRALTMPQSAGEWLSNLGMMFIAWRPDTVTPRLSPATWALTVELFFYVLICAGASRSPRRVAAWVAAAACYAPITMLLGWSWHDRYFPLAAAALPFGLGASIYYLRGRLPNVARAAPVLVALFVVNAITRHGPADFYISLVLAFGVVLSIAQGGCALPIPPRLDYRLGEYSYPVYLLHYQAGIVAVVIVSGEFVRGPGQAVTFAVALAVLLALCTLTIRLIDRPIQSERARIKSGVAAVSDDDRAGAARVSSRA